MFRKDWFGNFVKSTDILQDPILNEDQTIFSEGKYGGTVPKWKDDTVPYRSVLYLATMINQW